MVRFIDVECLTRIVSRLGLANLLDRLTNAIEEDFCRWPEFEKSARLASHSEIGVIELMPVTDGRLYSFKYVNGHPANAGKGLPTVMAFGALAEVETGRPLLLSEMTVSTALRTAATSVVAARQLARRDSRIMAMIGCGAQSEFQAIAFHTLLGVYQLRIYDTDQQAMQKLIGNLGSWPELKVIPEGSVAGAVKGADIVTTVTADKSRASILTSEMVAPGVHINGLGGDCPGKTEIDANLLNRCRIFVEYEQQSRREGDVQQLPPEFPVIEIWQVLTGNKRGRESPDQITFFDSVGFALEDFSVLRLLYQLTHEPGLSKSIELIPELDDPKNLYSLIASEHGKHAVIGAA